MKHKLNRSRLFKLNKMAAKIKWNSEQENKLIDYIVSHVDSFEVRRYYVLCIV